MEMDSLEHLSHPVFRPEQSQFEEQKFLALKK
jgi:hypothetical protein